MLCFSDATIPPVRFFVFSVVLLNLPLPVSCLRSLFKVECPNEIVKEAKGISIAECLKGLVYVGCGSVVLYPSSL